jgi:hypothetical protein
MIKTLYTRQSVKTVILFFIEALFLASCAGGPLAGPSRVTKVTDPNPVSLGTADMATAKFFSAAGLNENEAKVLYYTDDDLASLEFRYQLVSYRQYWDEPARKVLLDSVSLYLNDSEAKNFPAKGAKARHAYGSIRGLVEWQQLSFFREFKALPYFDLGYSVKDADSYFTITQNEAQEVNYPGEKSSSLRITLYFTPEQVQALAAIFADLSLVPDA